MKTDPNKGCPNENECFVWAFIHDAISHPLMAITAYSKLSMRFHNYTSYRAWPRVDKKSQIIAVQAKDEDIINVLRNHCRSQGIAHLVTGYPTKSGYHYSIQIL